MATRIGSFILLLFCLTSLLIASCSAFAGGGFGAAAKTKSGGKKKKSVKKKGKKKSSPLAGGASSIPQKSTISLGPNKSVDIWVPPNTLEGDRREISKFASSAASSSLQENYASFRGTGDVIWPSALQLSRLVANCPSFVSDQRVLDLGCGLGLASLAALLCNPRSLALSDIDEPVLDWAMKSCEEMQNGSDAPFIPVERLQMDWSDSSTWPENKGAFDVVLASDILYDAEAAKDVANCIAHVLLSGDVNEEDETKRALIVDPIARVNREAFVENAAKNGLLVEPVPFPGQEKDFVLINVTPRSMF